MAVRHGGREVLFDWAPQTSHSIQWAAFFSDCEPEVREITEGYRVTLAYSLHWTNFGPGSMADKLGVLEPDCLYFFGALKRLFEHPRFLERGGLHYS